MRDLSFCGIPELECAVPSDGEDCAIAAERHAVGT
jgi:hypothetical protein